MKMQIDDEYKLLDNLEDEDSQKDKYLSFKIGKESYAVDIANVTEIVGMQEITPLPDSPDYLKGIIDLRGSIYPVVDVRLLFGMEANAYNNRTCIIILSLEESQMGLIVDEVSDVLNIIEENLAPPPRTHSKNKGFIKGIGKIGDKVIIIIDSRKFFSESNIDSFIESM